MADAKKRFLDYSGLSQFWGIIVDKFATKNDAVKTGSFAIADGTTPAKSRVITYTNIAGEGSVLELPGASREKAGLMSASHYALVDDLEANIESMAPFAGLKIEGNEVSLTGRKANIKLKYESGDSATGRNAYISLIDADYPANGTWSEITEAEYNTGLTDGSVDGRYVAYGKGTSVKYYKWSENAAGPVNSLGEPLYAQPISKIDVSELVKSGILLSSDVVILDSESAPSGLAGTYLKLIFDVSKSADVQETDTVYINVTDLVEMYSAGEGITITHNGTSADDQPTTGIIKINAATDTTLGGIKTAYTDGKKTYAVKLDVNNNAYVAVPWESVNVTSESKDTNGAGQAYLTTSTTKAEGTDTDGNPTVTYVVNVEAGEGLKRAEALAKTSIQTITDDDTYVDVTTTDLADWGKTASITLTQTAKDSLALADSAVQEVKAGSNYVSSTVETPDTKGAKKYSIDLTQTTKNSLALADSAVQELTILGTKLDKTSNIYTVAQATVALELGSSANTNITTDATLSVQKSSVTGPTGAVEHDTLPTTAAVKSYVDNSISTLDTNTTTAIKTAIESLDSQMTAGTTTTNVEHSYGASQMVYTTVAITDGKLDTSLSTQYALKLKDITDFAPLSVDDINTICRVTTA